MIKNSIVWIRDDFRLQDNPALSFATNNHEFVSAIYIYDKKEFDNIREAQKWWISKSLKSLNEDLLKNNISLEIIEDNQINFFKKFKSKDIAVYWNKIYEPQELKKDKEIITELEKNKMNYKFFKGNVLNEYNEITKNDGTPFKVYSPFWRNAENYYIESVPLKNKSLKKLKKIKSLFVKDYGTLRDYPSINGTSRLSPYIRSGQIHVSSIWRKCNEIKPKNIGIKKYVNEIGWREFSHSLINYFPEMLKGNLRKEFDRFPWVKNKEFLNAWKQGMTGYPIVDAGMRQLYETGWMHNRIRMVVGSFLVKHLRINWVEGEKHFRNCLLDFNEANNVAQWQWVAGCGADAAPYFRIFNPILQGEKFDKEGTYVKKWVPELSKVPSKYVHKPWEMEDKYQKAINTVIGKDYPKPIVIHEQARAEALKAFQSIKKN